MYGLVASDATVSRMTAALATDATKVLAAIDTGRADARATAWALARDRASDAGIPLATREDPDQVWTPAYYGHGQIRDGAWVAELTGLPDLTGWPKGVRVGRKGTCKCRARSWTPRFYN